MKKIILTVFLLFSSMAFATTNIDVEPIIYNASLQKFEYGDLDKNDFATPQDYKTYKKISKLYKKGRYEDILAIDSKNIPALYALYLINDGLNNNKIALDYLYKISDNDKYFVTGYISKLILIQKWKLKDYKNVIADYHKIKGDKSDVDVYIADTYLNLKQYDNAINFANKISKSNRSYYFAQEIKYKAYYRTKNYIQASKVAKNLIALKSDISDNYVRAAYVEKNYDLKLDYLYNARKYSENREILYAVNKMIFDIEQQRLNKFYKSQSMYIDRLDWEKILLNSPMYKDDSYWLKRQDDFFKQSNICMSDYKGNEVSKCFRALKDNENILSQQLQSKLEFENNKAYRHKVIKQKEKELANQRDMIRRQDEMIMNQNQQNYRLYQIEQNQNNY